MVHGEERVCCWRTWRKHLSHGNPLPSRIRIRDINFPGCGEVISGSFGGGGSGGRSAIEGRNLDNVNLAAEAGERQVANGAAAVVAVTDNDVGEVNDFLFGWMREGDTLRLTRDMDRISYGPTVTATMHGETT